MQKKVSKDEAKFALKKINELKELGNKITLEQVNNKLLYSPILEEAESLISNLSPTPIDKLNYLLPLINQIEKIAMFYQVNGINVEPYNKNN